MSPSLDARRLDLRLDPHPRAERRQQRERERQLLVRRRSERERARSARTVPRPSEVDGDRSRARAGDVRHAQRLRETLRQRRVRAHGCGCWGGCQKGGESGEERRGPTHHRNFEERGYGVKRWVRTWNKDRPRGPWPDLHSVLDNPLRGDAFAPAGDYAWSSTTSATSWPPRARRSRSRSSSASTRRSRTAMRTRSSSRPSAGGSSGASPRSSPGLPAGRDQEHEPELVDLAGAPQVGKREHRGACARCRS